MEDLKFWERIEREIKLVSETLESLKDEVTEIHNKCLSNQNDQTISLKPKGGSSYPDIHPSLATAPTGSGDTTREAEQFQKKGGWKRKLSSETEHVPNKD